MSCFLVEMPADAVVLARRIDETKTKMSSMSLMGSIVVGLGENYIYQNLECITRMLEDSGVVSECEELVGVTHRRWWRWLYLKRLRLSIIVN